MDIKKTIIGESKPISDLINNIAKISSSMVNILILGDTGTGKELIAESIHKTSDRGTEPFVAINCASIPEQLLESELFGYVKGAFTGADAHHKGLISSADKGILFLDEVGDMPLNIQAKLLRVIETKKYRPLGAIEEQYSDFRLIAATHKDLKTLVKNNLFRRDLYYRMSQYTLIAPSLIERALDIPLLVEHFIKQSNVRNKTTVVGCTDNALMHLNKHFFKGNVRELRNMVETACMLTDANLLEVIHFEKDKFNHKDQGKSASITKENNKHHHGDFLLEVVRDQGGLKEALSYIEKKIIIELLEKNQYKRKKTSELLGLPLRTLAYKCRLFEL